MMWLGIILMCAGVAGAIYAMMPSADCCVVGHTWAASRAHWNGGMYQSVSEWRCSRCGKRWPQS